MRRLKSLWQRLKAASGSERGTILIEAAFSLPLMILLLLGGFETSQYILAHQKLSRMSSTMADSIAQSSQALSERQVHDLLNSMNFISRPFDIGASGRVVITALEGSNGVNTVLWRRCAGGIAQGSRLGSPAKLPNNEILPAGTTAVVGEAIYDYKPVFTTNLFKPVRMSQVVLYRTRVGAVSRSGPVDDRAGATLTGMQVSSNCG